MLHDCSVYGKKQLNYPFVPYLSRIVDHELNELLPTLPAVSLEGAEGVGKTETALQRARTVYRLDDPARLEIAQADPDLLLSGDRPILLDEWQRLPPVWDKVRRAVDAGAQPGSFLLTGSASPKQPATHSGAGRIVTVRMRPPGNWRGNGEQAGRLHAGNSGFRVSRTPVF